MINMSWTEAPAGAVGVVVRPRSDVARAAAGHGAVVRCSAVSRRAPEAFTPPFQGTGLPFAGSVLGAVVPPALQRTVTDITHTDATTLGNHSSRRPPS